MQSVEGVVAGGTPAFAQRQRLLALCGWETRVMPFAVGEGGGAASSGTTSSPEPAGHANGDTSAAAATPQPAPQVSTEAGGLAAQHGARRIGLRELRAYGDMQMAERCTCCGAIWVPSPCCLSTDLLRWVVLHFTCLGRLVSTQHPAFVTDCATHVKT